MKLNMQGIQVLRSNCQRKFCGKFELELLGKESFQRMRRALDFAPCGICLQIFFADIRLMDVGWLILVLFVMLLMFCLLNLY